MTLLRGRRAAPLPLRVALMTLQRGGLAYQSLTDRERREAAELVRASGGRRGRLSKRQRHRLRKLAGKAARAALSRKEHR